MSIRTIFNLPRRKIEIDHGEFGPSQSVLRVARGVNGQGWEAIHVTTTESSGGCLAVFSRFLRAFGEA